MANIDWLNDYVHEDLEMEDTKVSGLAYSGWFPASLHNYGSDADETPFAKLGFPIYTHNN